jgi:hypothetical protein
MKTYSHLWQSLDDFSSEWEMFYTQKDCAEKQNTFYVQQLFPENRTVY